MHTCDGMPDIRNEHRPVKKSIWIALVILAAGLIVRSVLAGIETDYADPARVAPTLDNVARIHKAAALVTMDEINILRQWDQSFKAAVAASTSLADLKTRVAALPAMPDRTATQIVNAVTAKLATLK